MPCPCFPGWERGWGGWGGLPRGGVVARSQRRQQVEVKLRRPTDLGSVRRSLRPRRVADAALGETRRDLDLGLGR